MAQKVLKKIRLRGYTPCDNYTKKIYWDMSVETEIKTSKVADQDI